MMGGAQQGEHPGVRVILLASEVIESSVTAADIEIVIDTLLHKRMGDGKRLQVDRISRAEADQRRGRAGRLRNGKVYRIALKSYYDSAAFMNYPAPEMTRLKIDDLLLQFCPNQEGTLTRHGIKEQFDSLITPPPQHSVDGAVLSLMEAGAVLPCDDGSLRLSCLGQLLREIRLEPRLALCMINGLRFGCLVHAAAIVAVLRSRNALFEIRGKLQWGHESYQAAAQSRLQWSKTSGNSDVFASMRAMFAYRAFIALEAGVMTTSEGGPANALPSQLSTGGDSSEAPRTAANANVTSTDDWCRENYLSKEALEESSM
jgi:HrpA-like RNA helicase